MITFLLSAMVSFASAAESQETPFLTCVRLCNEWYQPGWELRQCVFECRDQYDPQPKSEITPMSCETTAETCAEADF
jgi:hypothetical protein